MESPCNLYCKTSLNMQISLKLRESLQALTNLWIWLIEVDGKVYKSPSRRKSNTDQAKGLFPVLDLVQVKQRFW